MTGEFKISGSVSKLRVEPGDVLVVTAEDQVSSIEAVQIRKTLTDIFPGHEVLIVDDGAKLSVARPGAKRSFWARLLERWNG